MDARGLRAVDIIDRTGIPKVTLSYYMSGKTEPKADRVYTLAKVLDVSEAWLMGFEVPMARSLESKKNDALVEVVARLRSDETLYNLVIKMASADDDQLALIDKVVSGLLK
jgi:transcriptional regulator with XRE-family HTH domain